MIAENQTSLKATACNNACLASITFLFGVLFYVFTTDESKYGGSDCVMLRLWAYRYGFLMMLQAAIILLIIVICVIAQNKEQLAIWSNMVHYICSFVGFVLWIIIIVAYFQRESCGDLTTLIQVCLWIMIILLAFSFCFMCCAITGSVVTSQSQS